MTLTRKDVHVYPPPATWGMGKALPQDVFDPPTPQEIIQAQAVELRMLQSELYKLRTTANTIANIAAFLIWKSEQDNPDPSPSGEVRVPAEFRDRLGKDIKLTAGREGDEIVARYSLRAPDHTWTTRSDG